MDLSGFGISGTATPVTGHEKKPQRIYTYEERNISTVTEPMLEFAELVLPKKGNFWVLTSKDYHDFPHNYFCDSRAALLTNLNWLDQYNKSLWYALFSFHEPTQRVAQNTAFARTYALDLDCGPGKQYATQLDAAQAIANFLYHSQLGHLFTPTLVSSGHGLHVYFPLSDDIPLAQWEPTAKKLAMIAAHFAVQLDSKGSAYGGNSVLRFVGTMNKKTDTPAPVQRLTVGNGPFDPNVFAAAIDMVAEAYGIEYVPKAPAKKAYTTGLSNLVAGIDGGPPADANTIEKKCAQVAWAARERGNIPEPQWYLMMGLANYCADSYSVAKRWSDGYPGWSEDETRGKMQQWMANAEGPPRCTTFEDQFGAERCEHCPFKGKYASPIQLGRVYKEVTPQQQAQAPYAPVIPVPAPYKRTEHGIVLKNSDGVEEEVFHLDIFPVAFFYDPSLKCEMLQLAWRERNGNWRTELFRMSLFAVGSREFASGLADRGLLPATKSKVEALGMYFRTYINEIKSHRTVETMSTSMGWKEDNTKFLLGNNLIAPTGTTQVALSRNIAQEVIDGIGTKGTLDEWAQATAYLGYEGMGAHAFTLLLSFAAPLCAMTNLEGLAVNLLGKTALGKSTMGRWVNSVWGDPAKLQCGAHDTTKSVFSRLGTLAHLPLVVDEMSNMDPKDVSDILYFMTQGKDRRRLQESGIERHTNSWRTICVMNSNSSLIGKLASHKANAEAEIMRLLELRILHNPVFNETNDVLGRYMNTVVKQNYGHAGLKYINFIVNNLDAIKQLVEDAHDAVQVRFKFKFKAKERFQANAIALAWVGGCIAQHIGLIQFDPVGAIEAAIEAIKRQRNEALDVTADAFEMIGRYLGEHTQSIIRIYWYRDEQYGVPVFDGREVRGRLDLTVDTKRNQGTPHRPISDGTLTLAHGPLSKWLALHGYDITSFKDELMTEGAIRQSKNERVALGKGTHIRTSPVTAIRILCKHPSLIGTLQEVAGVDEAQRSTSDVVNLVPIRHAPQ